MAGQPAHACLPDDQLETVARGETVDAAAERVATTLNVEIQNRRQVAHQVRAGHPHGKAKRQTHQDTNDSTIAYKHNLGLGATVRSFRHLQEAPQIKYRR